MRDQSGDGVAMARSAARELAAEMDPSLPGRVEDVLATGDHGDGYPRSFARDELATLLVLAAGTGIALRDDLRSVGDHAYRRLLSGLQRQFGIDEGVSADRDRILDAVVSALLATPESRRLRERG